MRVVDHAHLVPRVIDVGFGLDPSFPLALLVELCAGIGRRQRHLDRVEIQLYCISYGLLNGLARFSRKSHDKGAVDGYPEFFAIFGELDCLLFGNTFFYVFEDLFVAGFVAYYHVVHTGITHNLESLLIAVGPGVYGPGHTKRPDQPGNRPRMFFVGTEGVVVEGNILDLGQVFLDPLDLFVDIMWRANTHFLAGIGLGPETERAFGRTATTRIDRDVGIFEVRDRSEEHTSELQSQFHLVCRLLLE